MLELSSMNWKLLDILKNSKHKHNFPPRDKSLQLKEKFNARGILGSSIAATEITQVYVESASAVLEDFSETILRNHTQKQRGTRLRTHCLR